MNEQFKLFILTTLTFLAFLFAVSSNYYRIIYAKDVIHGTILNLYRQCLPSNNSFTIIRPDRLQNYRRTYETLPVDFIHAGPFLIYTAGKNEKTRHIATRIIEYTGYYRVRTLERDIMRVNGLNAGTVHAHGSVIIPRSLPPLMPDSRNRQKPELVYTRGLYLTGSSVGSPGFLKKIHRYAGTGINTIVFDAKDITGIVNYHSSVPYAVKYNTHRKRTIDNLPRLIRELKRHNIYVIARIAVFRDHLLVKGSPSLAIMSKTRGGIWNAGSRELWCDPTSRHVQDYNIQLAVELAEKGVDEIQFDYIRFPTTGKISDARYRYDFGKMSREEVIAHFLERANREISGKNVNLSIDIYGVVAWGKKVDISKTGQQIERLAQHCDVISPMLYPSHFNDSFDGYDNPADHPYHFISEGIRKVISLSGNRARVRPWLQAFKLRVSNYSPEYILSQVRASDDSGGHGYLFWNASNRYDTVLDAMESIKKRDHTQDM